MKKHPDNDGAGKPVKRARRRRLHNEPTDRAVRHAGPDRHADGEGLKRRDSDGAGKPVKRARRRRLHNELTDRAVRHAGPGRHADGEGLHLLVRDSGSRSWVQRIMVRGKRPDLGLGGYPLVSLAEARQKALDNRRLARAGGDPREGKEVPPTFRAVYEEVVARRAEHWRSPKTKLKWRRYFRDMIEPVIGDKRVDHVTLKDVERIVLPHWRGRGSSGHVVRMYLEAVFEMACLHGYRLDNPARVVKPGLPKVKAVVAHHPSLPYHQVREAMAAILASRNDPVVKDALLFTVLCGSRVGEAVGAMWREFDFELGNWFIPAARMKAGERHRVPLSVQALDVLARMRRLGRSDSHVFVLPDGGLVESQDFKRVIDPFGFVESEEKRPIVMHGFRGTFRTWGAAVAEADYALLEVALAHVSTPTVQAYFDAETALMEPRRKVMQEWADYVVPRS